MDDAYRTRFAPTPSGYLHLGNLFNFVLTRLVADDYNARVFLRIDDLDEARYRTSYARHIFKTLNYFNLVWDEGPKDFPDFEKNYRQRYRLPLYRQNLNLLWEKELLYSCKCSRKEIALQSTDGVYPGTCREKNLPRQGRKLQWRWKTPASISEFNQYAELVKDVPFPDSLKDASLRKKDGYPAYQLTSVVDDEAYGINLIVRGSDLYDSSLAQVALAKELNYKVKDAQSVHHSLIKDEAGEKLSKSQGAKSLYKFVEQGRPPAIVFRQFSKMLGLPAAESLKELRGHWQLLAEEKKKKILF